MMNSSVFNIIKTSPTFSSPRFKCSYALILSTTSLGDIFLKRASDSISFISKEIVYLMFLKVFLLTFFLGFVVILTFFFLTLFLLFVLVYVLMTLFMNPFISVSNCLTKIIWLVIDDEKLNLLFTG